MTHDQLIVAQAEAFTILRDLMHMKADDPRPQRIINTIKQAALAILRLKPLAQQAQIQTAQQPDERQSDHHQPSAAAQPAASTHHCDAEFADPVAALSEEQFDALIARLPHNTLHPRTDKQRVRLERHFASFGLPCTDEIKAAIVSRASRRSSRSDNAPQAPPHAAPRRAA